MKFAYFSLGKGEYIVKCKDRVWYCHAWRNIMTNRWELYVPSKRLNQTYAPGPRQIPAVRETWCSVTKKELFLELL